MAENTYVIDKKFVTHIERTPRVLELVEAFGLVVGDKEFVVFDALELKIKQGDIVYITGQSGAGKSVLLRELEHQMTAIGKNVVNLDKVAFDDKPLCDQVGKDTNEFCKIMSVVGLSDANIWVRKPSELSDGQRYRFKLAKAIETKAEVLVADEFLAVLDRVAAKTVAFNVQKVAREMGATLLVATTHQDLAEDLQYNLLINKRYREKIAIDAK